MDLGGNAPKFVAGGRIEDRQVLRCHVGQPLKMIRCNAVCCCSELFLSFVIYHLEIDIGVSAVPVNTGHHDVALEIPGHRHHHCVIVDVNSSWI